MKVEEDLTCSFQVLRPEEKVGAFKSGRPKTPIKRGGGLWFSFGNYKIVFNWFNYIHKTGMLNS